MPQMTRRPEAFDRLKSLTLLLVQADESKEFPEDMTRAERIARFLLARERRNLTKSIFHAGSF
jgi:hypothetical protein